MIVEKLYLGTVEEVECEAWDCLVSEQFFNEYTLRINEHLLFQQKSIISICNFAHRTFDVTDLQRRVTP